MSNPFSDIDTNKTKIPLQKSVDGIIKKKKAGRPRRPNMGRYIFKMDKSLHAQLVQFSDEHGMNKSAVASQAVRAFITPSKSQD